VRRFPQPFDASIEARQKLADIAGRQGDARRRAALLADVVKADRDAGGVRTDRSRFLAAKAQLELAAPARDAFAAIRLTAPLKKSLAAKRAAMQTAVRGYAAADEYAVAEVSTAATYEIAELYRRLGADLMASERPKNLGAEELEQYDLLLEEQAFPFEEKAIEVHLVNAARAAQGIYDEAVRGSFAALAKLQPARFGKVEQGEDLATDVAAAGAPVAPPAGATADGSEAAPSATVEAGPAPAAVPPALAGRFDAALAAAGRGDLAGAEAAFAALTSEAPEHAGAPLNAGILQARAGRWAEAEASLVEASRRNPQSALAQSQLGLVLRELGRFGAAEQAYRRAIELDAGNSRAHRNLGVLLDLYLQRPQEALAHYEAALQLQGGDDRQISAWIAELRQRVGGAKSAQVQPS
jgi:tetratricopeptide (TPR) repeat protein